MRDVVIVSAVRTAVGSFGGALKELSAAELGKIAAEEAINLAGGAIALGHPIGCSGARILVTLLYEMKRRNARLGLAALCIGGGMGTAMIVER